MARPSISGLPLTQTGSVAPDSAMSLPCASASGATNSATSAATDCRSAFSSGSTTKRVELGDVEKLADDMRHAVDILAQRLPHLGIFQEIDARPQHAQRRAQFMGGVRGEVALDPESLFEPVEPLVDRRDQRAHLARNFVGRQPHAGPRRADALRRFRRLRRSGRSARRKIAMSAISRTSRIGSVIQPTLPIEVGDDVVDQHVAVGEVLAGLDPDGLAADGLLHARARHRGIAAALLQEFDRRRARVGGKQRRVICQRGEQHLAAFVDHGIGVAAIGLRIEPEQVGAAGSSARRPSGPTLRCSPTATACSCIALLWMLSVA